jgi:hypothetical protein
LPPPTAVNEFAKVEPAGPNGENISIVVLLPLPPVPGAVLAAPPLPTITTMFAVVPKDKELPFGAL